jgi:micrococcal nuclease
MYRSLRIATRSMIRLSRSRNSPILRIARQALLLTLLFAVLPVSTAIPQTYFDIGPVTYHTCYDGDTCMISLPGVHPLFGDHIPVRLAGIDTPEMKGKCNQEKLLAKQARDFIRAILSQAQRIELRKAERDKYFRVNALVVADDRDLSAFLIENGMAVPYDGGTKTKDWCQP